MKKLFKRLFTRTYTLTYIQNNDIYTAKYTVYEAAVFHALSAHYDDKRDPMNAANHFAINGKAVDFAKWNEEPFEAGLNIGVTIDDIKHLID